MGCSVGARGAGSRMRATTPSVVGLPATAAWYKSRELPLSEWWRPDAT